MNDKFRTILPLLAAALLPAALLPACSPSVTDGKGADAANGRPPLANARIGGPFALIDQDGHLRRDTDFVGKYRILYFGYTYCPDVCPVDVQTIGAAMRLLDKSDPGLAARIVPIFVTVDPERDTPPVLKSFVSAFHPRMIGLTGSRAQIDAVASEFAVFSQAQKAGPGGGYLVSHSRIAYLFGPDGKPIALLPQEKSPQAVVDEIKRWAK